MGEDFEVQPARLQIIDMQACPARALTRAAAQTIAAACVADPEPKKGTLITADLKDNQVD